MAVQICTLGGLVFAYNPVDYKNPAIKDLQRVITLGGAYYTVWGQFPQDQDIECSWPVMDSDFYNALDAKARVLSNQTFTDPGGISYTVQSKPLDHTTLLKGGGAAYANVKLVLMVVSIP